MLTQTDGGLTSPDAVPISWRTVARSLTQPYPVTAPMVALMLLVPVYLFIAEIVSGRTLHVPELALDRILELQPEGRRVMRAREFLAGRRVDAGTSITAA